VQFSYLTALFYDFQGARLAHFIGMSAIVLFLLVHVTLALLVPKNTGGDAYRRTPHRRQWGRGGPQSLARLPRPERR